jgi:hypothetical protein
MEQAFATLTAGWIGWTGIKSVVQLHFALVPGTAVDTHAWVGELQTGMVEVG